MIFFTGVRENFKHEKMEKSTHISHVVCWPRRHEGKKFNFHTHPVIFWLSKLRTDNAFVDRVGAIYDSVLNSVFFFSSSTLSSLYIFQCFIAKGACLDESKRWRWMGFEPLKFSYTFFLFPKTSWVELRMKEFEALKTLQSLVESFTFSHSTSIHVILVVHREYFFTEQSRTSGMNFCVEWEEQILTK